jgi:hypothetical protein
MPLTRMCSLTRMSYLVGGTSFVCPREGAGDWWDVCFLDVDDKGKVAVRTFNSYSVEEPGYRTICISTLDVNGSPVAGTKVVCQMESDAYRGTGDIGDTDVNGILYLNLPLGEYTASISHREYVASAVRAIVDLAPMTDTLTIPMVKADYFANPGDLLCVLTGGAGKGSLHIEAPGRCIWPDATSRASAAGKAAAAYDAASCLQENASYPEMTMQAVSRVPPFSGEEDACSGAAHHFQCCMLTRASAMSCPWVGSESDVFAHLLDDCIYVSYTGEGDMDLENMQLSLFSVDGLEFSLVPPKGPGSYWKVCCIITILLSYTNCIVIAVD